MLDQSVFLYIKLSAESGFDFNNPNLIRLKDLFQKNDVLDVDNFSSKEVIKALEQVLNNYENKVIVFECDSNASLKGLNSLLMKLKQGKKNNCYIIGDNAFIEKSFSPTHISDVEEINLLP